MSQPPKPVNLSSHAPKIRESLEPGGQNLVDKCLEAAVNYRASDIHIEPQGEMLVFRFRIDGRLKTWGSVSIDQHTQVLNRLKVLARLDIAEKRVPQDGRISLKRGAQVLSFRMSTVPMVDGEKAVVRVMQQDLSTLTIGDLGFSEHNQAVYEAFLGRRSGLVLHCGPSGSGKSTVLYAACNQLAQKWRNVQSIEDPIEGRLNGVNQAQVDADVGLTFASLLRAYLRQDCDVIMIGEIRDPDTAQLAVQAALTGHLVLATLHSGDAAEGVSRMIDMGVSRAFLGAGLIGVVNQRLVRRLCEQCRTIVQPNVEMQKRYGVSSQHALYRPVGCAACSNAGFRGRIAIHETLPVDAALKRAIIEHRADGDLRNVAENNGMISITRDGVAKAVRGQTTVEEVHRAVQ
jgi:type II secretory ATPase GspE/PulE/Tfp pilus assembly ATPase PilB-like protein